MANNKVVLGNEVLIDLTNDTVSAETLLAGETAHGADGNLITGIATTGGATIVVTYGSDFYGETITCSLGTKTYSKVATSSGEVEFTVDEEGTWTISCLGITTTVDIDLDYESELILIPDGKTVLPTDNIQMWLACAGIRDKDYTTLAEVLEDSVTFNALLGDSNACDYMARSTTFGKAVSTVPILSSDIGDNGIAFARGVSASYYAWYMFDGDDSTFAYSYYGDAVPTITNDGKYWWGYHFITPIVIKRMRTKVFNASANNLTATFTLQGSNDGETWTDVSVAFELTQKNTSDPDIRITDVDTEGTAYSYYRLYESQTTGRGSYQIHTLELYTDVDITTSQYAMSILGRYDYVCDTLLSDSTWAEAITNSEYWESVLVDKVPFMTSATTPKGKATATVGTFDGAPYLVFGGGAWTPANNVSSGILYYDFEYPILIKKNVTFSYIKATGSPQTLNCKIVGSNDETNWTDISEAVSVACGTSGDIPVDTDQYYRYIGLSFSGVMYRSGSFRGALKSLNFYGRHLSQNLIPQSVLHSVPYDTIFYLVNNVETVLCTCDADGVAEVDWSTLDLGEIQLYSTTAKDPDNLSDEFGMTIRVTPNKVDAFVIPDKALYWWGYEDANLEEINSANGWSMSGYTFDALNHNNTNITYTSPNNHVGGVTSKQTVSAGKTIKTISKKTTNTDFGGLMGSSANKVLSSTWSNYIQVSSTSDVLTSHTLQSDAYPIYFVASSSRGFELSALLIE